MTVYEFGDPKAGHVLLQMVDEHDLSVIENEAAAIQRLSGEAFCLKAVRVRSWNQDLSPWRAPAVFGTEDFGDGAGETLTEIMQLTADPEKQYYIGGYSLAGLFALWAAYQTDIFQGVAAASPSIWFPGFLSYMKENPIRSGKVYLSLGDREEKTRNPVMAAVGTCIREGCELLKAGGIQCVLEWNPGNHFKDSDLRTAKAFAWVLRTR